MQAMRWSALILATAFCAAGACARRGSAATGVGRAGTASKGDTMALSIMSEAFAPGGRMPRKISCDGENASPPLAWKNAPANAKSLALICDDPDAPSGDWVHWIAWNIPTETGALPAGLPRTETFPNGMAQGANDFHRVGYDGPCPPSGTHHYHFRLYALDARLDLPAHAERRALDAAMKGHVIAQADLVGLFAR